MLSTDDGAQMRTSEQRAAVMWWLVTSEGLELSCDVCPHDGIPSATGMVHWAMEANKSFGEYFYETFGAKGGG